MNFKLYRTFLNKYFLRLDPKIILLAGLLILGTALQLLNPLVISSFIDRATSGAADQLAWLGILFLSVTVLIQLNRLASSYLAEDVAWQTTNALRNDLAQQCLGLDRAFHKQHSPGELIERIDGDSSLLANFFSKMCLNIAINLMLMLGILGVLAFKDWRLGAGMTLYCGLALILLRSVQGLGTAQWEAERRADADFYGFIEERIAGVEDICTSGAEDHILGRLEQLQANVMAKNRRARMTGNLSYLLSQGLSVGGTLIGLAVGIGLYQNGEASIGAAFAIVYYVSMLTTPLENLRAEFQDLQKAAAAIHRSGELMRVSPKLERRPITATLPDGPLRVSFCGVRFAYEEYDQEGQALQPARQVLDEISFTLEAGKTLGVLGRTGSGKSTLSRLLFRMVDPQEGSITVGPTDVRNVSLQELRGRIGWVTQEVELFEGTLRDNLILFNPEIKDEHLERVLDDLQLLDWVRSLPAGLDSQVPAGGVGYSSGEAQLLALGRAFLKNPGLVILDEASSRLDPIREAQMSRSLARLLKNRTGILIAHRLQTLSLVDYILILDEGRVLEYDSRDRLSKDLNSRYSQLLKTGLKDALL